MDSSNVSSVYISVIEDVVANVREDFIAYGVGDAVLNELQALWEMKMLHCGSISGSIRRHTPLQTTIQYHFQGQMLGCTTYQRATGSSDYVPSPISDMRNGMAMNAAPNSGRPSPFMQPPAPWMNQRPLGVDVNVVLIRVQLMRRAVRTLTGWCNSSHILRRWRTASNNVAAEVEPSLPSPIRPVILNDAGCNCCRRGRRCLHPEGILEV